MSTVTLMPTNTGEKPHHLTVSPGEAVYWAFRAQALLAGQLAYVRYGAEDTHLPYLGHIACPDDDLANVRLREWRVIQSANASCSGAAPGSSLATPFVYQGQAVAKREGDRPHQPPLQAEEAGA